jgi:hypothetical protein
MKTYKSLLIQSFVVIGIFCFTTPALALSILGSAQNYAVLGGSTVTNTNATTINGDVGVAPGSAATGMGSVILTGTLHLADGPAAQAQSDANTAYNYLAGTPVTQVLTGQDLGGKTLMSGVYFFSSSAQLTGTLTLDAQGNANALFIFEIASTLTTASNSAVNVINGGANNGIFWQVGSSATLGTGTAFEGNIIALTSITLNSGSVISCGRALALNGAVTMDTNTISTNCTSAGYSQPNNIPEPGLLTLLIFGASGFLLKHFLNIPSRDAITAS